MEKLTIREIISKYKKGDFDIIAWNKDFIKNIKEKEENIHAWVYFNEDEWLIKLDAVLQNHVSKFSDLLGVPVGIKDIFNTVDMPTCMGSPIWKDFTPGNDARVVHNIKFQGGISAGKTVTAEFAVHTPNETRNPRNKEYSPGTSSSGSAAAVASGMVPLSLGTQTAGSIIRPASYCGIYGFKPSFGTIPRTGMLKTTDTLDTVGLFANDPDDCLLLFDTIRVKGLDYPLINKFLDSPQYQEKLASTWKIGVVADQHDSHKETASYAQKAFSDLISNMNQIKSWQIDYPVFPDSFNGAHAVQEKIYHKALSYYFQKEFENATLISPVMYEIVEEGKKVSTDEYIKNIGLQSELKKEIDDIFNDHDVLITLSTAGIAPAFGTAIDPPDTCLIWTMCDLPVINLPLFSHQGMPFGLQVIGRKYQDHKLIRFVKEFNYLLSGK